MADETNYGRMLFEAIRETSDGYIQSLGDEKPDDDYSKVILDADFDLGKIATAFVTKVQPLAEVKSLQRQQAFMRVALEAVENAQPGAYACVRAALALGSPDQDAHCIDDLFVGDGKLVRMSPYAIEDLNDVYEWMREPDHAETASFSWLVEWMNRRPLPAVGRMLATMGREVVAKSDLPLTEVIRQMQEALAVADAPFNAWKAELAIKLGIAFGTDGNEYIRQTGEECWREMFESGRTPEEAIAEELSAAASG